MADAEQQPVEQQTEQQPAEQQTEEAPVATVPAQPEQPSAAAAQDPTAAAQDPAAAAPQAAGDASNDLETGDVRTIFVSNLPQDVTQRELYHMFNRCPGLEDIHVRAAGRLSLAFILFSSKAEAETAVQHMNGYCMDPDGKMQIRTEMAKQNTKPKRNRDDFYPNDYANKRMAMQDPAMGGAMGDPYAQPHQAYNMGSDQYQAMPNRGAGNQPCNTIFVANLNADTTEDEVRATFSAFSGFRRLRTTTMRGNIVAFIEYSDVAASTYALQMMQGRCLREGDTMGVRIEYARKPMGTPGGNSGRPGAMPPHMGGAPPPMGAYGQQAQYPY